jgi:Methylamine utilisation protein MauE
MFLRKKIIVEILSTLFIFLFVYAGVSKLIEADKFKWALANSPLITNYAGLISRVLPVVELITAILLFIPRTRASGLFGSLFLMIIFTLYLAYMISFSSNLPCSCGGVLQQMSWKQHLGFNIIFTFLAAVAIRLEKGYRKNRGDVTIPRLI